LGRLRSKGWHFDRHAPGRLIITYAERDPALVAAAKALQAARPRASLREIAAALAEQGYVTKVVTMNNGATKGGVPY
jgi:hypothetical protein